MAQQKKSGGARSAARLAAVQALYQAQMDVDTPIQQIIEEYKDHRLGQEIDDIHFADADAALFSDIVAGTWERSEDFKQTISGYLKEGWTYDRLEVLLRAILLAGCYEMAARPDVPTAVIINEYVDVTHAFCEKQEAAFVNGILDKCGKQFRQ